MSIHSTGISILPLPVGPRNKGEEENMERGCKPVSLTAAVHDDPFVVVLSELADLEVPSASPQMPVR